MKNIFDVILNSDSFKTSEREPAPMKEILLKFLKNGKVTSIGGIVIDFNDGKWTGIESLDYESGEFYWDSSDIYHFEKYDVKLNDDFVQYVLNRPE